MQSAIHNTYSQQCTVRTAHTNVCVHVGALCPSAILLIGSHYVSTALFNSMCHYLFFPVLLRPVLDNLFCSAAISHQQKYLLWYWFYQSGFITLQHWPLLQMLLLVVTQPYHIISSSLPSPPLPSSSLPINSAVMHYIPSQYTPKHHVTSQHITSYCILPHIRIRIVRIQKPTIPLYSLLYLYLYQLNAGCPSWS